MLTGIKSYEWRWRVSTLLIFVRLLKDFLPLLFAEICSHSVSLSTFSDHWITKLLDYFDTEESSKQDDSQWVLQCFFSVEMINTSQGRVGLANLNVCVFVFTSQWIFTPFKKRSVQQSRNISWTPDRSKCLITELVIIWIQKWATEADHDEALTRCC